MGCILFQGQNYALLPVAGFVAKTKHMVEGGGGGAAPPPPPPLMSSCPQGGWQLDMKGEGEGRGADVCAQDYA